MLWNSGMIMQGASATLYKQLNYWVKPFLLNPKIETAYHFRGFAYSQLNKFDLAIEDYNQIIRLKPDDARVYNNWGNAYAGLGQHQRAIEFEESKAIGRHPDRDK